MCLRTMNGDKISTIANPIGSVIKSHRNAASAAGTLIGLSVFQESIIAHSRQPEARCNESSSSKSGILKSTSNANSYARS